MDYAEDMDILSSLVLTLLLAAVFFYVLYLVIRNAVSKALQDDAARRSRSTESQRRSDSQNE